MVVICGNEVGITGFGLMSLTPARGDPIPRKQAFEAMNAALDAGASFWNGGQFYGTPENNSLHLLRDYFQEFPEKAEKVTLSIKGGLTPEKTPDGSESFIRQSVETCIGILPPTIKKIDIFQCARVDPNVPIEEVMETLKKLALEGKFSRVGLSEVNAKTIRRANECVPIAAAEVEFSLFETEILANGVASTCAELGIPVVAYSPLGRGVLTGQIKSSQDISPDSALRIMDRFQAANIDHNMRLIQALNHLVSTFPSVTLATLALSWLRVQSLRNGLPAILPISGSSKAQNVQSNALHFELLPHHLEQIDQVLAENQVKGPRAYNAQRKYING